jgi:hypothetical protein
MVRYRKSKKIGPFRITLTQKGISTSIGEGGFRISTSLSPTKWRLGK